MESCLGSNLRSSAVVVRTAAELESELGDAGGVLGGGLENNKWKEPPAFLVNCERVNTHSVCSGESNRTGFLLC